MNINEYICDFDELWKGSVKMYGCLIASMNWWNNQLRSMCIHALVNSLVPKCTDNWIKEIIIDGNCRINRSKNWDDK